LRVSKRGMSSYTCTLENGRLLLYISGSCLGNGQDDARGGIGVYWGDDNARNLSRPITDQQVPTNNRAILTAAIHAIRQARKCSCRPLMLKSNNSYLVDSVERFKHIPLWRCTSKFNWTLANVESAKNQDLLKKLHALLRQRGSDVRFERVKKTGSQAEEDSDNSDYSYGRHYDWAIEEEQIALQCAKELARDGAELYVRLYY